MTSQSADSNSSTLVYVVAVAATAVATFVWALGAYGLPTKASWFGALLLLGLIAAVGRPPAIGSIQMSASGFVQLAAIPLIGPVGTTIIAALPEAFRRTEPIKRVFNTAQRALLTLAAATVYRLLGGATLSFGQIDTWSLAWQMVVAAAVGAIVNAVLLAGVLQLSTSGSLRSILVDLIWQAMAAYGVYTVAAFMLAILWAPVGMGWAAVFFFLPSLLVIQWALRQLATEWTIRHEALAPFVTALDVRFPGAAESSRLTAEVARVIAAGLHLKPALIEEIARSARLRDVGMLALDDQPAAVVRRDHARACADVLGQIGFLGQTVRIIAGSHERVDGRGGPQGLVCDQIPIGSRVLAVADAWSQAVMEGRSRHEAVLRCELIVGQALDLECVRALRRAHQRGQLPLTKASP